MWRRTILYLCVLVSAIGADADVRESRLVNITQGPVRGYKDPESDIFFFQGIPYASTPTGPNRFKPPLPPPTWMLPLEAVINNVLCPQKIFNVPGLPKNKQHKEDCLMASVYAPNTEDQNLSVVVYVHGGGFQGGSGDFFIPTDLVAENNIIAVTFNYRVGAHGFLCLGTEGIPGNAGMKDQVAALRWVKQNIASFGGNPDDVTIAGYSAGSAAVDLLMLSKSAEDLFSKVIPESGASIAPWTIQSDPLENAIKYALNLNFTNVKDINALEDFYKTIPFERLFSVPFGVNTNATFGPSPCVERSSTKGEEAFLSESPVDILIHGNYKKLPLLYGFSNMEGLMRIDLFDSWKQKMNEKFSDFLPADLKFESEEEKEEVAKGIKHFYFGDKPVGEETILSYIDFFTDVEFAYPMLRAVKFHLKADHGHLYLYEYSFVDDNTSSVPHTNVKGANHGGQTLAVFNLSLPLGQQQNKTKEFLKISNTIRKIWGHFIKTGRPVGDNPELPAWPAVRSDWGPHMSLSNEITLRGSLLERRARFWDDIYEKYYRDPVPPPNPAPKHFEL